MQEIENSFASNICRCTGYRPILDAFKSFAEDAHSTMKNQIDDIEVRYKFWILNFCFKIGSILFIYLIIINSLITN